MDLLSEGLKKTSSCSTEVRKDSAVAQPAQGKGPTAARVDRGSRAVGLFSIVTLCICTIVVYVRMYNNVLRSHEVLDSMSTRRPKVRGTSEVKGRSIPQDVNLTLREAVENVSGKERSIIFVSSSAHYLDFLENWHASVSRFGYGERVLFIAEDEEAHAYLKRKWPLQTILVRPEELNLPVSTEDSTANSTYGSRHYNSLVDRRPEYFKALIDLNVTFLYNDVDIVWLKDPYPFFTGNFDMWVQEDAIFFNASRFAQGPALPIRDKKYRYAACTCFMMVRPTRASRFLIHRWSRHVRARVMDGGKAVLNQPAFNKALSLTPDSQVRVGILPVVEFPSGYIFFKCGGQPYCKKNWSQRELFLAAVKQRKTWPAMVHNNWLEGHDVKLKRFKDYSLWFLD